MNEYDASRMRDVLVRSHGMETTADPATVELTAQFRDTGTSPALAVVFLDRPARLLLHPRLPSACSIIDFDEVALENLTTSSHSATAEPHAMEAVQPFTWKRASAIRPASTRALSLKMSPQTGFSTVTLTAGAGSSPANLASLKCFSSRSLYNGCS